MHSLTSPNKEDGIKKEAIASSLFEHFELLVEQVNPEDVARKLYGIAVLDDGEVQRASDRAEPQEDRARSLVQLVKKKLWKNPSWFVDVCKVLRACGVKAISQVIGKYVKVKVYGWGLGQLDASDEDGYSHDACMLMLGSVHMIVSRG